MNKYLAVDFWLSGEVIIMKQVYNRSHQLTIYREGVL